METGTGIVIAVLILVGALLLMAFLLSRGIKAKTEADKAKAYAAIVDAAIKAGEPIPSIPGATPAPAATTTTAAGSAATQNKVRWWHDKKGERLGKLGRMTAAALGVVGVFGILIPFLHYCLSPSGTGAWYTNPLVWALFGVSVVSIPFFAFSEPKDETWATKLGIFLIVLGLVDIGGLFVARAMSPTEAAAAAPAAPQPTTMETLKEEARAAKADAERARAELAARSAPPVVAAPDVPPGPYVLPERVPRKGSKVMFKKILVKKGQFSDLLSTKDNTLFAEAGVAPEDADKYDCHIVVETYGAVLNGFKEGRDGRNGIPATARVVFSNPMTPIELKEEVHEWSFHNPGTTDAVVMEWWTLKKKP